MPEAGIAEQLSSVPNSPGVYLWKDAGGRVIYVGKAKELRKRMRQYVLGQDGRERIPAMMGEVASFEYVVTSNEVESLILEANLIKRLRPRYNVDFRDDKSFPFIALTMSDPFPGIKYTREKHRKGTRYFGPYTDARAARETIDVARRVFPICRATCVEWKRVTAAGGAPVGRACFDYHVGRGPGPCVGAVTREAYAHNVKRVAAFLEGRRSGVPRSIETEMLAAAADLDFERAARLRTSLEAVRSVLERQTVVLAGSAEADVVGIAREETIAGVHVVLVREGRVLAGNEFVLDSGMDVPLDELAEGFLLRHYGEDVLPAKEVILPALPPDPEAVEGWLGSVRGGRVRLLVPQRGTKRKLAGMAEKNARHVLGRFKARTRYDDERLNEALIQLESALALERPPMRIECFDVSTLHGRFSTGSMVVFVAGRPERSAYKRFRVRMPAKEADDVAMMREVLARRFGRSGSGDTGFADMPDLVIVDGGKPQLRAALTALGDLSLSIPVVALAKREEEIHVPGWDEPVSLPLGSASLYLVRRIRDEAHRFAIEYHRALRGRAMTASSLDEIPGVGPKRKKALLKEFGSLRRLREAGVDAIAAVPGIPQALAEDIAAVLREE